MRSLGKLCSRATKMAGVCLSLAAAGCAGNGAASAPEPDASAPTDGAPLDDAPSPPPDQAAADAQPPSTGSATATFSSDPIDFGNVDCGGDVVTRTLTIAGSGVVPVAVTATTTGTAFSVSPTSLSLGDGGTGTLTISARIPASATAGAAVIGALDLFTNDSSHSSVSIPLSAMPTGATLAFAPGSPSTLAFPTSEVGVPAPALPFGLVNTGNAGAAFSVGAPSNAAFSVAATAVEPTTVMPGTTWALTATFTPASAALASATSAVSATGPICGASLASISYLGQGTLGQLTGWPTAPIDFGAADCGGSPPATQSFTLTNVGTVAAKITRVSLGGASGFVTNAAPGRQLLPGGGVLFITVTAPAVPSPSPLTPITGTLTIVTDADPAPHVLVLTMQPRGAVLSFDPSPTPGFGNFGSVVLLDSATQRFNLKNTGNGGADVALSTAGAGDGGPAPFQVTSPTVSLPAGAIQEDTVTFAPLLAGAANGSIAVTTTSPLCAPLPAPVPLSGVGLGGGPIVAPASLQFPATCGGAAPASQSFLVSNQGSSDLTWSLGPVTGPGAAQYTVSPGAPPGLLAPGQSTVVTVQAAAVSSPASEPNPAGLAASVTITTDVPLDPAHVVALGEIPLGDQLSFSLSSLRFGQPPIGTTLSQTFALENDANPGSAAASVTLGIEGNGASGYTVTPVTASSVPPGGGVSSAETVAFSPSSAVPYPATITLHTSDPLCTPPPAPIQLSGTGAQGKVVVSATSLAFGTDPADPAGLVNCGGAGLPRSLTIANAGNAAFQVTALGLGLGPSSPYHLSGDAAALPATVPIGGSVSLMVTPSAIPAQVTNPDDPNAFADTLTITTSAALDAPHAVALVMQARGAVIASTPLSPRGASARSAPDRSGRSRPRSRTWETPPRPSTCAGSPSRPSSGSRAIRPPRRRTR